ncbi:Fungal specific transcription factor domain [Ceratobasidium sp. AG-Ba]|nr:Fungal specific transcription factor domain [Ceratobasidium sp. AG-Ba]QRW07480.1 Fungal specific transcription factor domain [Ceratobasidium sp. AG-Ba]
MGYIRRVALAYSTNTTSAQIKELFAILANATAKCSWADEGDSTRAPTKPLLEALRFRIKSLESELTALRSGQQSATPLSAGSYPPNSFQTLSTGGKAPVPFDFRPTSLETAPQSEQSPWLAYQAKHAYPVEASIINQNSGTTYEFIFNIDVSISILNQPENIRKSLSCDWSRHLPLLHGAQLTRLEHDVLLDRCFGYSSNGLMSVVPELFLHDMLHALSRVDEPTETDHYSPLLHCSLLAFAAALSDDYSINQFSTRETFAGRAKQILYEQLDKPSITLIQALNMLSGYYYGLGRREQGYMYLGRLSPHHFVFISQTAGSDSPKLF